MNFAVLDGGLRAERLTRYELAMDQQFGETSVGAFTFYEGVRDQLVNAFEGAAGRARAAHLQRWKRGHRRRRGDGRALLRRVRPRAR